MNRGGSSSANTYFPLDTPNASNLTGKHEKCLVLAAQVPTLPFMEVVLSHSHFCSTSADHGVPRGSVRGTGSRQQPSKREAHMHEDRSRPGLDALLSQDSIPILHTVGSAMPGASPVGAGALPSGLPSVPASPPEGLEQGSSVLSGTGASGNGLRAASDF